MHNDKALHWLAGAAIAVCSIAGTAIYHDLRDDKSAPAMPDPKLTPGAVVKGITKEELCTPGYSAKFRHVTQAEKKEVFRRYGIRNPKHGEYEIDHRVPIEGGGDNVIENLWPQPYHGPWNAHDKDRLENKIHELVCQGVLTPEEGQAVFLGDWVEGYEKHISN